MSNCIYLKQKFNHKFECKKNKQEICLKDCSNCPYKEYKKCTITVEKSNFKWKNAQKSPVYCANSNKNSKKAAENSRKQQKAAELKKKSNKLAKLEKNRFSLFTDDLNHCIICGKSPVNKHEIFGGRNRLNSIKYGLVIPLCTCEHHDQLNCRGIHFDKKLRDEWHKKGQVVFEQTYPDLKFEDIFKKNYLK